MDLVILNKSELPLYEQIYRQIISQIMKGDIKPHTCLPSIRTVAKELQISIITVKKAWEMLEQNGFIYTKAGKGCFVNEYDRSIKEKKLEIVENNIKENIEYYKSMGVAVEELIEIIKNNYNK